MTPPRPSSRPRRVLVAVVVGLGLLLAACAKHAPQTTLKPQGPEGTKINNLFNGVFWVAVVFFILVEFGVLYLVVRYRHRDNRPEPVQVHGNTRLELTWTLVPALIRLALAIPTFKTSSHLARKPKDPVRVTPVGPQL